MMNKLIGGKKKDDKEDEVAKKDEEEVVEEEEVEVEEEEHHEGEEEEALEEHEEEHAEEEEAAEEEGGDKTQNDQAKDLGLSTAGSEINVNQFEELRLESGMIQAANDAWRLFINTAESREAAGEAIYAALFEGAPSLQSLFTTPRAVQAMKFMNGLASFVQALDDPPKLKILVETLGFGHLHLDVTVPRVVIFRDAILDLLSVELAERFTTAARDGWKKLLNYVGGAIIFVKVNFAERINTLLASWKLVNDQESNEDNFKMLESADMGEGAMGAAVEEQQAQTTEKKKKGWLGRGKKNAGGDGKDEGGSMGKGDNNSGVMSANQVPKTYTEMFKFNAAVMGFGTSLWFNEVLSCFHNIVTNVSNSARLQEECDVLVLRISKVIKGSINFAEYKSCMLASLRSLLPKDWSTAHEVAWSWLWENVERLLTNLMGKPPKWEKALGRLLGSIDETQAFELRKEIYSRFFTAAPAGQDFFKQSNTYLHFIADKIMQMTLELYQTPVKMVDDISALGLRHVGYAIPTELFGPFVTACVEVIMTATQDDDAVEGFRWSLGLVSKMLVRTITEGSTIVMKAINTNSVKQLKKAISCAPRGERASWMLIVQVGTQDISPLSWALESGALESALAIIQDLLTFRADRDRYYYGMDTLFKRHPDIVQRLCNEAPALLPRLFNGLIWRSRVTENGLRRVNIYLKHLLVDVDGKFSPTLTWIAKTKDPKIVCHPVIVLLSDTVWGKVACQAFMFRKSWFLFTLSVFVAGQSILKHSGWGETNPDGQRQMIFGFRAFIYAFNMTQLMYTHGVKWWKACKNRDMKKYFGMVPLPTYLGNWQDCLGFGLMICLMTMLALEPIVWCLNDDGGSLFTEVCKASEDIEFAYSLFSMFCVFLYFFLLIDLAVLSTKVSAYVLVCIRMLSEVGLFLLALVGMMLAFSSGISVLKHDQDDFAGIHKGLLALLEMTMKMYSGSHYEKYEVDPVVLTCVFVFLLLVLVFLVNMLIAQLTCAYESVYVDMVGYARLERVDIIVVTMPNVSERRWSTFVGNMKLDSKIEFNPGDIGVTGGVQTTEPASANPTTVDMIRRFGGSTSVELQWPVDDEGDGDENDRFDRIENLIQRTLKRLTKSGSKRGDGSHGGTGTQSGSGTGSNRDDEHSGKGSQASEGSAGEE